MYNKTTFYSIIASIALLFLAAIFFEGANYGSTKPTELTLNELGSSGPQANAFVRLEDYCIPGKPVVTEYKIRKRVYKRIYIPLFSSAAESTSKTPISVVLQIDSSKADQLAQIQSRLADPATRLEGLCRRKLQNQQDLLLIGNQYQRTAAGASVIFYDSAPKLWMLFSGLVITMVVYAFYVLGTLIMCRLDGKPNTRRGKISMMVTGLLAIVVGAAIFISNTAALGFMFSVTSLTIIGIGIARLIVGLLAVKLNDSLFIGDWFNTNGVSCEGQAFQIISGFKRFAAPLENIDAINTTTWEYPRNEHTLRHSFLVKGIADGKIFKINGLILDRDLPKYLAEFKFLEQHIADREWNDILDGEECYGEDWVLSAEKLIITHGQNQFDLPIQQFNTCREIEGEYRFWQKGDDEYVTALPADNLNMKVLENLLMRLKGVYQEDKETDFEREYSSNQSQTPIPFLESPKETGLGIVEYSETTSSMHLIFSPPFIMVGLALLLCTEFWILGTLATIAGLCLVISYFRTKPAEFRIHENGVSLKQGEDITGIAFDELSSFTFKMKERKNGTFIEGHSYDLQFASDDDTVDGKTIEFKSAKTKSNQYDELAIKASRPIYWRMAEQLGEDGKIEWLPGCNLYADGLEAPMGLSNQTEKVGFDRVSDTTLKNNRLAIYVDGKRLAACKLDATQKNFMPGYFLLLKMLEISHGNVERQSADQARELETQTVST